MRPGVNGEVPAHIHYGVKLVRVVENVHSDKEVGSGLRLSRQELDQFRGSLSSARSEFAISSSIG